MKKQLSKRIGAILTMTAMLMTLIPMAIPAMATGETSGNLITNGEFSTMDGWTPFGANATSSNIGINSKSSAIKTEKPVLRIQGKSGVGVTRVVSRLTGEKSYKLSMDVVSGANADNQGVEVTLTYGNYENDTFTALTEEAPVAKGMDEIRLFSADTELHNVSLNFNVPPTANAMELRIEGRASASSGVILVDNVKLVENAAPIEMINNGSVDAAFSSGEYASTVSVGWTRKGSGTIESTIEKDSESGNSYMTMTGHNGVAFWKQGISLRHGKVYELSFKFSQNGLGENVSPNVQLTGFGCGAADIKPVFVGVDSTDTITWKEYKTFITVDKSEDYIYGLTPVNLILTSLSESDWVAGGEMYYDDISLVEIGEIEEADKMAFAAGKNGEFTTTPADAKVASCIFVQGETPTIQKFIVAKYNSTTNALESATTVNAGEGIAAGNAKRYDVEIADDASSYYRIFLWNGTTLKPVLNSEEIGR